MAKPDVLWFLEVPGRFQDDDDLDWDWWEYAANEDPRSCGPGCGSVRPEYYGEPIDVMLEKKPRAHLEGAPMAGIISAELADLLEPFLDGAVWGRCVLSSSGTPLDSHVSVYTPIQKCAMTRGEPGTTYWRCPHCGRVKIEKSSSDQDHVDARTVPNGCRAIQYGGHCGILVAEDLKDPIKSIAGRTIEFVPYPVL